MDRFQSAPLYTVAVLTAVLGATASAQEIYPQCVSRLEKLGMSAKGFDLQDVAAFCRLSDFLNYASRLQLTEPFLYANKQFKEFQGFTLEHQMTMARDKKRVQRLLVIGLPYLKQPILQEQYDYFFSKARQIWGQLPEHIILHQGLVYSQNPEEEGAAKMKKALDVDRTFKGIASDLDSKVWTHTSLECDYTSQPTNALWYSLTLAVLIKDLQLSLASTETDKSVFATERQRLQLILNEFARGWTPSTEMSETKPTFKF